MEVDDTLFKVPQAVSQLNHDSELADHAKMKVAPETMNKGNSDGLPDDLQDVLNEFGVAPEFIAKVNSFIGMITKLEKAAQLTGSITSPPRASAVSPTAINDIAIAATQLARPIVKESTLLTRIVDAAEVSLRRDSAMRKDFLANQQPPAANHTGSPKEGTSSDETEESNAEATVTALRSMVE